MSLVSNQIKINVGVLIPNETVDTWIYNIIDRLSQNASINLTLIKWNFEEDYIRPNGSKNLIIRLHERIDAALYSGRFCYNQKKNLNGLINGGTSGSLLDWNRINKEGKEPAQKSDFEVIIDFVNIRNAEKVSEASTFGILSFIPINSNV